MTAYPAEGRMPMSPVSPSRLPTQHSNTPLQPIETRQQSASEGKLTLNLTHKVELHPNLAQGFTSHRSSRPRPRFPPLAASTAFSGWRLMAANRGFRFPATFRPGQGGKFSTKGPDHA